MRRARCTASQQTRPVGLACFRLRDSCMAEMAGRCFQMPYGWRLCIGLFYYPAKAPPLPRSVSGKAAENIESKGVFYMLASLKKAGISTVYHYLEKDPETSPLEGRRHRPGGHFLHHLPSVADHSQGDGRAVGEHSDLPDLSIGRWHHCLPSVYR